MPEPEPLQVTAVRWPEILPGDDLADLLASIDDLRDGDIAVVTSKIVGKVSPDLFLRGCEWSPDGARR